jgi:hypothetical protein
MGEVSYSTGKLGWAGAGIGEHATHRDRHA